MMFKIQPQLNNDQITLKELTVKDTQALFEMRSDKKLCRKAGLTVDTHPAHTLSFILDVERKVKSRYFYYWGIFKKDILVGVISLWGIDYDKKSGELGYFIGSEYQRHGYMTMAIKLVVNYVLENTQILIVNAYVETSNKASMKLMKKLDFKLVGQSIEEDLSDAFVPMYQYEIKEPIV